MDHGFYRPSRQRGHILARTRWVDSCWRLSVSVAFVAACARGGDATNDTVLTHGPLVHVPGSATVRVLPAPESTPNATVALLPAVAPAPRSAREDSLIQRARVVLAAAEPDCREWPLSQYAAVKPDSETRGATFGPLIGDLDGDGAPDVVFDCYMRSGGGRTLAVLSSQRGQVSAVTGDDSPPPPALRRIRWMIAPYRLPGRRGLSVVVFEYDDAGAPIMPASVYEFFDGRFVQLIDGE